VRHARFLLWLCLLWLILYLGKSLGEAEQSRVSYQWYQTGIFQLEVCR
jgi:hypothetical protein